MTEALLAERAARLMAQAALERGAEEEGAAEERDRARLALWHEEVASEQKSLHLVLEAVREMKAAAGGGAGAGVGPATPERPASAMPSSP
jgi:hypothetical protein